MRHHGWVLGALMLLAACDGGAPGPAEGSALQPLSVREQAILTGAESALRQGDLAVAERDYLSAVAASNGHIEGHLGLARLYAITHQTQKQRDILARAAELQPNNPTVNYLLGKLELADGDQEAALGLFNKGLKTAPDDLDLLNASGIANDMLGRHLVAQSLYQRAAQANPRGNLVGVHTNLAMSYLFTNQPKQAVALLKPEVKKPRAASVTRQNLALAYGLMGEHAKARALLKGEVSESARMAALERLKAYIADRSPDKKPVAATDVLAKKKK